MSEWYLSDSNADEVEDQVALQADIRPADERLFQLQPLGSTTNTKKATKELSKRRGLGHHGVGDQF